MIVGPFSYGRCRTVRFIEKVLQSEAPKKLFTDNDLWTEYFSRVADKGV
jgi:hypothetical protein